MNDRIDSKSKYMMNSLPVPEVHKINGLEKRNIERLEREREEK